MRLRRRPPDPACAPEIVATDYFADPEMFWLAYGTDKAHTTTRRPAC